MVVEPEPLAYDETREPLVIQLGCCRELCLRHPTGGVHTVLGEDACDRGAGKAEVTSHGANVANSEIAVNERLCFIGSELTGALRSEANFVAAL